MILSKIEEQIVVHEKDIAWFRSFSSIITSRLKQESYVIFDNQCYSVDEEMNLLRSNGGSGTHFGKLADYVLSDECEFINNKKEVL